MLKYGNFIIIDKLGGYVKRVGILTLPLTDSYGGILQAMALYTVIEGMGCDVKLIVKKRKLPKWKSMLAYILGRVPFQNIKSIRSTRLNARKNRAVIDCVVKNRSGTIVDCLDLNEEVERGCYDAVVVGSDQVWRYSYVDAENYSVYFLNFYQDKTRKISYAASFGVDTWEAPWERENIQGYLNEFHAVSVREDSGLDLCRTFGRKDCVHVVDPTLLVDPGFYSNLMSQAEAAGEVGGLLSFILDESEAKTRVVDCCSRMRFDGGRVGSIYKSGSKFQVYTIQEWLRMFSEADFVVTDSYHGMVFSIIFKKQFMAIANKNRGASRFESLLDKLGLASRLIGADDIDKVEGILEAEIDYADVEAKLEVWRNSSREFLSGAIGVDG